MNKYLHIWRLLLVVVAVGCGPGGSSSSGGAVDLSKVRAMGDLYGAYLSEQRRPPADEADFRAFLDGKRGELEESGITVDQMFVSPRNGEPITWVYGKQPTTTFGLTVIAYEQSPTEGRRLVLATNGMFDVVDESRFKEMRL